MGLLRLSWFPDVTDSTNVDFRMRPLAFFQIEISSELLAAADNPEDLFIIDGEMLGRKLGREVNSIGKWEEPRAQRDPASKVSDPPSPVRSTAQESKGDTSTDSRKKGSNEKVLWTRRNYLTYCSIVYSGANIFVASESVSSVALAHPDWDMEEKKTWIEWEEVTNGTN